MSRQPAPEPEAERPEGAGPTDPIVSDTEGHSLAVILGVNAMTRRPAAERKHRRDEDADLRPMTKPFPRMRPETRD